MIKYMLHKITIFTINIERAEMFLIFFSYENFLFLFFTYSGSYQHMLS